MKVALPTAPEGVRHIVVAKFSGGRSSALAALAAHEAGVADHVVFQNTGMESAATYDFIEAVNEQWLGGRLVMLERRAGGALRVVPSAAELCREAEPMREFVRDNQLPSPLRRSCTEELKVRCGLAWIYEQCDYRRTKITGVVGFRADEPRRLARMRARAEAIAAREDAGKDYLKWSDDGVAPLADAGLGRQAVLNEFKRRRLRGLAFDPADENIRLSNCEGCFHSNQAELLRVVHEAPARALQWEHMELEHYERRGRELGERPKRRAALARAGVAEPTAFELNAYACNQVPWAVLRRMDRPARPASGVQEELFAGGCGDGECGLDI